MNKQLLIHFMFCTIAILFVSCNDSESQLLEPKVYFENKEYIFEVGDQATMMYDLQSRVSAMCSSQIEVTYAIADASFVDEYNTEHGTNYEIFNSANVDMSNKVVTIFKEEIYSEKSLLKLSNLSDIEEGNSFILPIQIKSSSLPIIDKSDILYLIINKPARILKAAFFYSNSVKVPLAANKPFKSLTYEAIINIDRLRDNNTIMGCEGVLILRIGDKALPDHANNLIQIAGKKQFNASEVFVTDKWYHVAFTYDQPSGKAIIYVSGKKVAESTWDTPSFDLTSDGGGFFVGKVAGFMWGERPYFGYMSEVRLWSIARTENEINQNMLGVNPNTEGLAVYYKFDGSDQYEDAAGDWYIKDASGHQMDGLVNRGSSSIRVDDLSEPIRIK